jgi:hypothetical protein
VFIFIFDVNALHLPMCNLECRNLDLCVSDLTPYVIQIISILYIPIQCKIIKLNSLNREIYKKCSMETFHNLDPPGGYQEDKIGGPGNHPLDGMRTYKCLRSEIETDHHQMLGCNSIQG